MWWDQMSLGVNFDLVKLVLSLSHTKKKTFKGRATMKHVSNFSTAMLNWSNLYALTVISQTWQLLKEHIWRSASFHVSSADYCTLSTPRHFRDDKKIRDSSLVSEPPIQLAEGLSWQYMISSLGNDALWPCGEVHPLHLQYIITGSFVPDWPMLLFTVHLKRVASLHSSAHPPTNQHSAVT